jgi:hypothetical protein
MEKFKIALSNGNEIDNLTMNGNNFVSEEEIDESIFEDGLEEVHITSDGGVDEVHENMVLVQVQQLYGAYYFILRDRTQYEIDQAKTRSDIEYIAMMTDVDIEA